MAPDSYLDLRISSNPMNLNLPIAELEGGKSATELAFSHICTPPNRFCVESVSDGE